MKIFFLTSRFPFPLEKGDKLRAFHQLTALAQRHEVVVCALTHAPAHAREALEQMGIKTYVFELPKYQILTNVLGGSIFGQLPVSVAYFFNKKTQIQINKILHLEKPELIFAQLIRTSEYVKNIDNQDFTPKKILDLMDAFSIGAQRRAISERWWSRWFWRIEAQRLAKYESEILAHFDQNFIISDQDRAAFPTPQRIQILPNGVDTDFFSRTHFDHISPDFDLVFVGNMGYYPNVEAAKYLANVLLPDLQTKIPTARLLIAGARPTAEVRALQSKHVEVTGWVDDIRTAYARGRVFVAPLFNGSGQQNKILEAMAMGLPCVTTNLVNNALNAKQNLEILTADTGGGLSEHVFDVLTKQNLAKKLSEGGRNFVVQQFSWHQANQILENWFNENL